ncbi:MAG: chemotaxis protein CheW [Spirochaetes bacterium]|nr:chemotaxis protein CheW [Spirochaetota bacterium]MBU0954978.1 chemotaxis protein CheW [Spirochaetota bacterium]
MSTQNTGTSADSKAESGQQEEKRERGDKIDYKMVTFSLAGKEYGIDIMNVKEIARAGKFTYVPNAAPFVRGVYNLRGDIISIIDLRTMFHLPSERKGEDALESLLILNVDDHVFGVIVDNIDKVVGISSSSIQPPHPIFGDINVKYIKGIIENASKLYIILNVEKLFAPKKAEEPASVAAAMAKPLDLPPETALRPFEAAQTFRDEQQASTDVTSDFIKETLFAFKRFAVTPVNEEWFSGRYEEWKSVRKAMDLQLKEHSEADQFLETFFSPHTGDLWSEDYIRQLMQMLPDISSKNINVWNPGCGKGYESYSLACLLKLRYPEARIKIWANDSDLLAISMAPNMVFMMENVPDMYKEFMIKGRNGWAFLQNIRDSIFFEFHDVLNTNPIPPVDLVLCRDTVSFLSAVDQKRLLSDFNEKTKAKGVLLLGVNERMPMAGWQAIAIEGISMYTKGA